MQSCDSRARQLGGQSAYRQAVANLESDRPSAGNPAANIPPAVEQSMEETCAADPDRSFVEIVKDHQTVRRPDDYPTREPPGDRPLRRVVTQTGFLNYHLLPNPEDADYWSNDGTANLPEVRGKYQSILKSKPNSVDNTFFYGATGKLGAPTWWTFLEAGRPAPSDAATYMEELMLDPQSRDIARREGGVVISIPARMLAGQTYKPCALDAFWEDTSFRPDHSERPYGMTCPPRLGLEGHPELGSA